MTPGVLWLSAIEGATGPAAKSVQPPPSELGPAVRDCHPRS
jgi:hypothetical protein